MSWAMGARPSMEESEEEVHFLWVGLTNVVNGGIGHLKTIHKYAGV